LRDNARILEEIYPGEFGEPKAAYRAEQAPSWNRPVLTYAEDRFSKSVDDILSGTVPAAESMLDHFECVFHGLAGEADDPLERPAQVRALPGSVSTLHISSYEML